MRAMLPIAAAVAFLFIWPSSASAEPCVDPDPDPLRRPIRQNRIPLYVAVENVRSPRGNVVITLYPNDPGRWLVKEGSLYIYTVPASVPTTETCIVVPGLNVYAIVAYHDRNGNGRLGQLVGRVPTEPVGGSRNPCTGLREPRLEEVRMRVDRAGIRTSIWLRHPYLFRCRPA